MNKKRYLAPWHRDAADLDAAAAADKEAAEALAVLRGKPAIYHCVTRLVHQSEYRFDRDAKEKFVSLMRLYEGFCQLRVLTYCVMADHVHLLVEVPAPMGDRGDSWSDEEFLTHIAPLYTEDKLAELRWELEQYRAQKNDDGAEAFRRRYFDRIGNLAEFIKPIKQAFSRWFNPRHNRRGTLWEERFKNVLIEEGHAAQTTAAYIDMNPVRAELVDDPKDYRWCGYSEAVAGKEAPREGLRVLMADKLDEAEDENAPWREVIRHYREVLFPGGEGEKGGGRLSRKDVARVLAEGGELSEGAMVLSRARHLSAGLVFGSEEFVNMVFALSRDFFGPKRKSGARKIRGVKTNLRAMRDLQRDLPHEG